MRDIKFRVWDKDCKRMHVCGEDVHDSITFGDNNEAYYYNLQNGEGSGEGGAYVLMQYTGIKDKNDKEVYEGDVVVGLRPSHWHDGYEKVRAVVIYKDDIQAFSANGRLHNIGDLEVIGNIHDNPELLQPQGGSQDERF